MVYLSEKNLDPSVPLHDVNLEIQGYELVNYKLLQNKIVNLTNDSRDRYYIRMSNKLNDIHVSPKLY